MFQFNYPRRVYCSSCLNSNPMYNNSDLSNSSQYIDLPSPDKINNSVETNVISQQNSLESLSTIVLENTDTTLSSCTICSFEKQTPKQVSHIVTPTNSADSKVTIEPLNTPVKNNSNSPFNAVTPSISHSVKPSMPIRYKTKPLPIRPALPQIMKPQVHSLKHATPLSTKLPGYLVRPLIPQVSKNLSSTAKPSISIDIQVPTTSDTSTITQEIKKTNPPVIPTIKHMKTSQSNTACKKQWWLKHDEYLKTILS